MNIQSSNIIDGFLYTLWELQDSTSYGLQVDSEGTVKKRSFISKAASILNKVCACGRCGRTYDTKMQHVFQETLITLKQRLSTIEERLTNYTPDSSLKKAYQNLSSIKDEFSISNPIDPTEPRIPFYMINLKKVWKNTFGRLKFSDEKAQLQETLEQFLHAHNDLKTKWDSLQRKRDALVEQNFHEGQLFLKHVFSNDASQKFKDSYPLSKIEINNSGFYFYTFTIRKRVEQNNVILEITLSDKSTLEISVEENELPLDRLLMLDQLENIPLLTQSSQKYSSKEFATIIENLTDPATKKRIVDYLALECRKRELFDIMEKTPPEIVKEFILPSFKEDLPFILSLARDVRRPLLSKFCNELLCEYINEKQCSYTCIGLNQDEIPAFLRNYGYLITYFEPVSRDEYHSHILFFPNLTHLILKKCPLPAQELQHAPAFPKLQHLVLEGSLITDLGLEHLQTYSTLQSLDLGGCRFITNQGLRYVQALPKLESLGLCGCHVISNQCLQYLQTIPNLKRLGLRECNITNQGLLSLQSFPKLESIGLSGCPITDEGLEYLKAIPNLQRIGLNGCEITVQGLEHLQNMPQLQKIGLKGCRHITGQVLELLQGLPALRSLDIDGCEITNQELQHVQAFPKLERLGLSYCRNITNEGLLHFVGLHSLQDVDLSDTSITDQGVELLQVHSNLQSLNLSETNITDQSLQYIGAFPNLQNLSLGGCRNITDEGIRHVQATPNLKRINLRGSLISNQGLKHLQTLSKLESIGLRWCHRITDNGFPYLYTLPSLRRIHLTGCWNITDQGRKLLQLNLPKLQVFC